MRHTYTPGAEFVVIQLKWTPDYCLTGPGIDSWDFTLQSCWTRGSNSSESRKNTSVKATLYVIVLFKAAKGTVFLKKTSSSWSVSLWFMEWCKEINSVCYFGSFPTLSTFKQMSFQWVSVYSVFKETYIRGDSGGLYDFFSLTEVCVWILIPDQIQNVVELIRSWVSQRSEAFVLKL